MSEHPSIDDLVRVEWLDPAARREVLDHARSCEACRARLVEADPSALFSLLALRPVPAEALARLDQRLARELERDPRPAAGHGRRRLRAVAGLAASLLLAGVLGLRLSSDFSGVPPAERAAAETALPPPPARAVELLSTPGKAQVVDLAVGETRVVMIFSEGLEL